MSIGTKTVVFPSTILVVDDEAIVRQLLSELLTSRGLTVITAETSAQAMHILASQGIGCLLTDKNLGPDDGIEVLRKARELQPYCACLMMTGYSSTDSAVEALRLGATDYLSKPFEDLDLIAEKVDRAIRNEQALFERNALLERIRAYDAKLKASPEPASTSELEMFERVLDARIREATDDLRRKVKLLEGRLRSSDQLTELGVQTVKAILEAVRGQPANERSAAITERVQTFLAAVERAGA